jgi:DNA-directed RNA polymerase specialized sigma24 family protein
VKTADQRGSGAASFNTTHWTMVLACGDQDDLPAAEQALAKLYQTYWYPLYAYVRRRGYGEHDAEALVQGFYVHLQGKRAIAKADPLRGKFRSFLLTSLQNFLANEQERASAKKRGGGSEFVFLDADDARARYLLELTHTLTPEAIFEKRWAHTLLEQTLLGLRGDFIALGKERMFDGLQSFLSADSSDTSYQTAADSLGVSLSLVKSAVHRMRLDYRTRLRQEIARTVSCPEEIDEEFRHLRKVLSAAA